MATPSLSFLHRPTNSSLHAFHAGGVSRSIPPSLSSLRLLSPPLDAFRGSPPPRSHPSVAGRLMTADVARSLSPNSMHRNDQRRLISCQRRAVSEENSSGVAVKEKENEGFLPPGWPTVALALFGLGFLLGPPLDAIHSRVGLQVYDNGAINLLGLKTNIWVPPLLGVFYGVAGLLQLVLDKKLARKGNMPTASLTKVAASFVSLAVLLELSAELYNAGVPANIEGYTLFFCAQLNWVLLENTWWGFGLASLIGVACPLAEIPLLRLFGLWHYPQANVSIFGEGFVTWVICCYFFYTPFISNLARWLVSYQKGLEEPKQ